MINQLFRSQPSRELACQLVHYFGLAGLQDNKPFSKFDMRREQTIEKIRGNLLGDLKEIYIHCKAKSYLTELDERSVITILRQILRTQGYTITSRSKYRSGERFKEYQITVS